MQDADTLSSELDVDTSSAKFSRTQVISPHKNQDATNGNIKVLLVVDNSPTMQNSQNNLSKNLNVLLGQLQNYSASIKIVSSTMYDNSCNSEDSVTKPALNLTCSIASLGSLVVTHDALIDSPQNLIYAFDKNMTAIQKENVLNSIRMRIADLGTSGTDNEAPLGAFVSQLDSGISNFFATGDKALVYILTDEDDSFSISALQKPRISHREGWTTREPGLKYYYSGFQTGPASCDSYDEVGIYKGRYSRPSVAFGSLSSCTQFLADNSRGNCSWAPTCTAGEVLYDLSYPLDGKSISVRCAEVSNTVKSYHAVTRCIPNDFSAWQPSASTSYETYILGWTRKEAILKTVKNKLTELFGSKYLISISTNLPFQSCRLKTGQTYDRFFSTTFAAEIPAANLLITSICDADNSGQAVKKIAEEFENIINNDYLVSLAPYESIAEVHAIVGGGRIVLKESIDYKIESNTFKILGTHLQNFERIEIQIQSLNK